MSVEFVIRTADLRQAIGQLKANRGKYSESDFVDILVSESVAIFRAVGTESEAPVNGKIPGPVRVPLSTLGQISEAVTTFKAKELLFHCEPGAIKVGTWSVKNDDIKVGTIPDRRLNLPIDISVLDTLALAKILTRREINEEGMRARVDEALKTRQFAVADALAALQTLEITERQLQSLVDAHVTGAAERLRKFLRVA
ncbi:MAG: hypothetical protein ABSG23_02210 [Terriglobales bacterium]|jgi:hypothetical protein